MSGTYDDNHKESRHYISATIVVILVILLLDGVWLGVINKKSWNKQVKEIQGSQINVRPLGAITAYALLVVAIVGLVVPRISKRNMVRDSLLMGGLLGLCIYGVYDGTNYAILKDYKLSTAVVDMLWGVIITAVATLAGTWASYNLKWF